MSEEKKILPFWQKDQLSPEWVRKHPEQAEKILNSLPLRAQLELVLQRRGKERLELILLSHRSKALVRAMPEPELYLTIKELGEDEALSLLALANQRQLTYIFDLEFWKEQSLAPERICHWLDLLKQAGLDQFRAWLKKADIELLISILQKLVNVYVPDPDNLGAEPWRNKDLFTLDEYYYLEIKEEKFRPLVEAMLLHLRDIEQERYYAILDQVRWQVPLEIEELSYRVRQGRLEDYGFYDFDEAFRIYTYIPESKIGELEEKPAKMHLAPSSSPRYPLVIAEKLPAFIAQVIKELEPEELGEFYFEFARLANKVMIADVMDLTDLSSIRRAVEKVYGYLEIGLEIWSGGKVERALEIIKRHWLEQIFQVGFSQVLSLRFRAQRIEAKSWFRSLKKPFYLFGFPLGEQLKAILASRPRYFDPKEQTEREFRALKEVNELKASIEQAEFLSWLFFEVLGLSEDKLRELIKHYPFELSFEVILATALVQGVVSAKLSFNPLTKDDLVKFLQKTMVEQNGKREIEPGLKEEFIHWLVRRVEKDTDKEKLAREFAQKVMNKLEEELKTLSLENIDPKFISSVVFVK